MTQQPEQKIAVDPQRQLELRVSLPAKVEIKLTDEQALSLQELFNYARKRYDDGKPGIIFAQPWDSGISNSVMVIGYLENEYARQVQDIISDARKVGQAS